MPTVVIDRAVTINEAAAALQKKLGDRYQVTTRGTGTQEALRVKQSATAMANVRLSADGTTTTFRVHGVGLIITRMINELGIAKRVAAAIKEAFGPVPPTDPPPS
jgi:hypothetical protein